MAAPTGDRRHPPVGWTVVLILLMLLLATVYPATKRLTATLHPVAVSLFRYGLGAAAMFPMYAAERRRQPRLAPADWLALSLLGVLGIAVFSVCLTVGVHHSTASNGSLLVNSQPLFTALLAPLIIREKLTPWRLLGALAGVVGVYLVVTGGEAAGGLLGGEHLVGNAILVGAAVASSVYTMLLKPYVLRFGGLVPSFVSILAGAVVLAPAAFLFTGGRPFAGLRGGQLALLAYIGVVGTALVYPLFHGALGTRGVVRAVGFKLLVPVFGIALGVLLLGERLGWRTFLGAVVVIGAIAAIQSGRARIRRIP